MQKPDGHANSYRPDIDGLRTLAVLPVVCFHAGLPYLTGGYIGVDVFFVISGFLITGIIAKELAADRFSIAEFYRRRARRIFPALSFVGILTMIAGYLFFTPTEFTDLARSAAAISVFCSNFYFWKSVSYFHAGIQPLLHTWSLAVEEQYYVLFPLFMMVVRRRRRLMIGALAAVLVVSLGLSILLVWRAPGAAFYLLPSRAWELMLGGLLALGCFGQAHSGGQRRVASVIGGLLILVPVFAYTGATPFPGIAAVPPVLGAALMIWGHGWGLSSPALVWVGRRSYSLYLWHLPVIELGKYLLDAPLTFTGGIVAIVVSLVLSHLTFEFVETPFRHGKVRVSLAVGGMVSLAALAGCIVALNGLPSRMTAAQARVIAVVADKTRHPSNCMTLDGKWVDPASPCRFGDAPSTLLWGDSHSMVTATSLQAAGVPFLFAADADCPIGEGLAIDPAHEVGLVSAGHYRRCGEYNRKMLQRALQPDVRTVVLSSRWTNWRIGEPANPSEGSVDVRLTDRRGVANTGMDNRAKFEQAFTRLVDDLVAAGKRVVIVGPMPEPAFNVPHRLYVASFGFSPAPADAHYGDRHRVILAFFQRFAGRPGVSFIWPADRLCGVSCPSVRDGVPVYFDHNHLTVDAARRLAPLYAALRSTPGARP